MESWQDLQGNTLRSLIRKLINIHTDRSGVDCLTDPLVAPPELVDLRDGPGLLGLEHP